MSTFAVTIEQVVSVEKVENSDHLSVIKLKDIGYEFVAKKDAFKVGDAAIYFPLDSLIPSEFLEEIGLWDAVRKKGMLGGSHGDRVRTIRLRGQISQGLVVPPKELNLLPVIGDDVTDILNVVKYEPAANNGSNGSFGRSKARSSFLPKYDLENCERHQEALALILSMPFVITEKVEGSHFAMHIDEEGVITYHSRNVMLSNLSEDHKFLQASRNEDLENKLRGLHAYYEESPVTLRGEIVGPGIQGNIYELTEYRVYTFDIDVHQRPIDWYDFINLTDLLKIRIPPVVYACSWASPEHDPTEWTVENFKQKSNDYSLIHRPTLREGIVIRPKVEYKEPVRGLDRLILKQRDPIYLLGSDS